MLNPLKHLTARPAGRPAAPGPAGPDTALTRPRASHIRTIPIPISPGPAPPVRPDLKHRPTPASARPDRRRRPAMARRRMKPTIKGE